ncbi:EAL domain-containing protein [Brevibacterium album]|uniref:EAL domain-containing protein n=1 Tax=Brevibacterium album TaxID=417948 RepID=UPI000412DAF0|nr:EAL domain-containing protein [Brevibacterium album]
MKASLSTDTALLLEHEHDLEQLVRGGLIHTHFSPVADLDSGAVIGHRVYHGIADAPADAAQFAGFRQSVRRSEHVADIDASLRSLALREAESLRLPRANRLFLTAEPQSLGTVEDRTGEPDRSAILQLHPDSITQAPAMTLRSVRQARALGWGIGMASIGADLRTTAFLPLVNPSVVMLHATVLGIEDTSHLADLTRLLQAHMERTGAILVADGVHTEEDVLKAQALGAHFGTGPWFGPASRSPEPADPGDRDVLADHHTRNLIAQGTPFTIAQNLERDPLVMDGEMLTAQLRSLAERSLAAGESAVVISVFGDVERLDPDTVGRFERIADAVGYTVMLSAGFDTPPVAEARGGQIDTSDPLRAEFCIIVIGPDWSGLTVAKRRFSPGPDGRTEYDVHVTTERYACVDAARSVFSRIRTLR